MAKKLTARTLKAGIMPDEKAAKVQDVQERLARSMDADVPQIYFNGFVSTMSSGDVLIVLERNSKPVVILNMSYTVAKTFALSLGQIISQFESGVERNMLTTDDVREALGRMQAAEAAKKETKQ
jgi:citrate lyase gamma subunit